MKGACAKKGWEHGSTAVLYSLYPRKVSRKLQACGLPSWHHHLIFFLIKVVTCCLQYFDTAGWVK